MLLYVSLFSPFRPLVHRECMYCRSIVHIVVFALSHSFSFSPVRFSSFRILSIKPSTRFFFWLPTKYLASIYTYIPSIHSFHFPFTKICGCFNLCAWVTIWFFGHVWIWVWVCVCVWISVRQARSFVCLRSHVWVCQRERMNMYRFLDDWELSKQHKSILVQFFRLPCIYLLWQELLLFESYTNSPCVWCRNWLYWVLSCITHESLLKKYQMQNVQKPVHSTWNQAFVCFVISIGVTLYTIYYALFLSRHSCRRSRRFQYLHEIQLGSLRKWYTIQVYRLSNRISAPVTHNWCWWFVFGNLSNAFWMNGRYNCSN